MKDKKMRTSKEEKEELLNELAKSIVQWDIFWTLRKSYKRLVNDDWDPDTLQATLKRMLKKANADFSFDKDGKTYWGSIYRKTVRIDQTFPGPSVELVKVSCEKFMPILKETYKRYRNVL